MFTTKIKDEQNAIIAHQCEVLDLNLEMARSEMRIVTA
jgi:hypothetical protein